MTMRGKAVHYQERYCAFIDILGFRELIGRLNRGGLESEDVRELLQRVHSPPPLQPMEMKYPPIELMWGDNHIPDADFRAQSISDAVTISTAVNEHGLVLLCRAVASLALDFLSKGIFIRGAIVKDLLYHDDKVVFGEALVRAYLLESQVVRFPRVMVTREVVGDMKKYDSNVKYHERSEYLFRRSEDGPTFVHVLRSMESFIGACMRNEGLDSPGTVPIVEYYASLGRHIQRRFDESTDNLKHFEKVQWFGRYWNECIASKAECGFDRIVGPGLDKYS